MWRPALLCVLLASGAARAAVTSSHDAACPTVKSLLLENGVAESALSSSSGGPSEVCQAGSCCTRPWELGIRDAVHRDFRKILVDSTDPVKNLLYYQANAVQDSILRLIHDTNQSTINSYSQELEDRQASDNVARHALPTLFGKFSRYFQSDLSDPELEDAITDFFSDLFVVTYGKGSQLNATFEDCLRNNHMLMRPFHEVPYRMKEKLLRTFGIAKFYLQSLYGGLSVLNTTMQFQCSDACSEGLTRLRYCPLCRGLQDVRPCSEFCSNVIRGCMAPLSTLSESWQNYVDVLRKMATSLQSGNNIGEYLLKVYVNISEAMSLVFTFREELDRQVRQTCGTSPATTEPSRRRRRELDMQYRSSGDLGGALPPLPRREHLIDFDSEGEQLHKLLRTFSSDVDLHTGLFQALTENVCNDMAQDRDCWNGQEVGRYTKPVAGINLDSQMFNPEVKLKSMRLDPELRENADLLDLIRQGSTDKLASMPTSDQWQIYDDVSGSGQGHFYNDDEDGYGFHDDYDYEFAGSGSGSGDYDYYDENGNSTVIDDYEEVITDPESLDGDITVSEDLPGIKVEHQPPITSRPAPRRPGSPTKTTVKPAGTETTAKPAGGSGGAAVTAGCWTLAAALLVARL